LQVALQSGDPCGDLGQLCGARLQRLELGTLLLELSIDRIGLVAGCAELGAQIFALALVLGLDVRDAVVAQFAAAQRACLRVALEQRQLLVDLLALGFDRLAGRAQCAHALDRLVLATPQLIELEHELLQLRTLGLGARQIGAPAWLVLQARGGVLDPSLQLLARGHQ
jgi:hypothetical protein